jgi:Ca2+-binding RTX toxin-like protein
LATVTAGFCASLGVALADRVECRVNKPCEGTRRADKIIGTNEIDQVFAKRGADLIKGRDGDDNTLYGQRGRDEIRGGPGRDYIDGGSGIDVLKGGSDSDHYNFDDNWGKETIDDDPIVDTDLNTGNAIQFNNATEGLVIKMSVGDGPEVTTLDGESTIDWAADVIDVVSRDGQGDDVITGRAIPDNVQIPNGGTDNVQTGAGNDFIYAIDGEANDAISCGPGNDDEARVDMGDSVTSGECEHLQVVSL